MAQIRTNIPVYMRRYKVTYSQRGKPRMCWDTVITAPSMQYIRDNWNAICGGQPFVLQRISSL